MKTPEVCLWGFLFLVGFGDHVVFVSGACRFALLLCRLNENIC